MASCTTRPISYSPVVRRAQKVIKETRETLERQEQKAIRAILVQKEQREQPALQVRTERLHKQSGMRWLQGWKRLKHRRRYYALSDIW